MWHRKLLWWNLALSTATKESQKIPILAALLSFSKLYLSTKKNISHTTMVTLGDDVNYVSLWWEKEMKQNTPEVKWNDRQKRGNGIFSGMLAFIGMYGNQPNSQWYNKHGTNIMSHTNGMIWILSLSHSNSRCLPVSHFVSLWFPVIPCDPQSLCLCLSLFKSPCFDGMCSLFIFNLLEHKHTETHTHTLTH